MQTTKKQLPDVFKMSSLERQIFGRNRINAYTIENVKKVLPQLTEFLNKKIELSDGGKAAKFKIQLLDVPFIAKIGQSFRTYLHFQYGELRLFNDITIADRKYEGGGYGVSYYKQDVRLGKIEGGVLTEIYSDKNIIDSYGLNKVFNAKTIAEKKAELEKLKDKVRDLEHEITRATAN